MLEVHPPEHAAHTWRDFFVHIATIVVGLLIAIGLEQSVEWVHHKHLVHQAHGNLEVEARFNQRKFQENEAGLATTQRALLFDMGTLRNLRKHPEAAQQARLTAQWSWNSFESSAYDTAHDTGALSYMPYQELQDIDSVYRQQGYVHQAMIDYISSMYRIRRMLAGNRSLSDLTPAEVDGVLDDYSAALMHVDLLRDLMRPLGEEYKQIAMEK